MNYRHAYHAGNFADVLKHATLALVIDYLKKKDAPLRVIDTHAGRGRYPLASVEADKTGEWRSGVGRLFGKGAEPLPPRAEALLAPYREAVAAYNAPDRFDIYPGSPLIAQHLLRSQDALIANELHPEERAALETSIGRDRRAKVMDLDGWTALKALLPPKERRGVVLIDPPFEQDGELDRMAAGLLDGLQRFATGVFIAWYPVKDPKPTERFRETVAAGTARPLLGVELLIHATTDPDRLNGCGLVIANPPYTLEAELAELLPEMTRRVAKDGGGRHRLGALGTPRQSEQKAVPAAKRRVRIRR